MNPMYWLVVVGLLIGISLPSVTTVSAQEELPERPQFTIYQSRVKQHRAGATGELVEGEEHLRKIILGWYAVPNAIEYEICHQCLGRFDEDTGAEVLSDVNDKEVGGDDGTIHKISPENTCGGQPCLVLPAAPIGYNRFHMRYKIGEKWSLWSKVKTYNINKDIIGTIHEEGTSATDEF